LTWRRILIATAATAVVPFVVMAVLWLFGRGPLRGGAPIKTLGNLGEFLEYGVVSGLALVGLRVAGQRAPRWRLLKV
jgi:hypothetical protein